MTVTKTSPERVEQLRARMLEADAAYRRLRAEVQEAGVQRAAAIRAVNEAGVGLRPIGEALGVHYTRVRQIINER